MNILLDVLTLAVCILASGCGQIDPSTIAPTPAPTEASSLAQPNVVIAENDPAADPGATPTPTATPTPAPTVVTYIYQDITLCTDIRTWDPNTTIIKTYLGASNGPSYVLFQADGVWLISSAGGCTSPGICAVGASSPQQITRSDIHGVVCTITVTNGQITGITP